MKKILVLMLVFGIASMATAGLTLTGPTEVGLGGTISLAVTGDAAAAISGAAANVYDPAGIPGAYISNMALTTNVTGGTLSLYTDYLVGYGYFYLVGANDAPNPPYELLAGDWVTFTVSANALAVDSVISITMQEIGGGFSTHNITVIPEPMTIGLLGLGGLFLRRRK